MARFFLAMSKNCIELRISRTSIAFGEVVDGSMTPGDIVPSRGLMGDLSPTTCPLFSGF